MTVPIFRPTRLRQVLALSMAIVVAFLGVAVFSSLHEHQGAKNRCSLNGFDQLMTGEAESGQLVLATVAAEWREAQSPPQVIRQTPSDSLFLRGPPNVA